MPHGDIDYNVLMALRHLRFIQERKIYLAMKENMNHKFLGILYVRLD